MARARLPLVINGTSYTEIANRTGYEIEYTDRTGENAFMALSADQYLDVLDRRPTIYWPLNRLTGEEMSHLMGDVYAADQVQVYYQGVRDNAPTWGWFHGVIGRVPIVIVRSTGLLIRDGVTLTLESR